MPIDPIIRIQLFNNHGIEKDLLFQSYRVLCMRDEPISHEEGIKMGLDTTLCIIRARELCRRERADDGSMTPSPVSTTSDLSSIVTESFKLTPSSSEESLDDDSELLSRKFSKPHCVLLPIVVPIDQIIAIDIISNDVRINITRPSSRIFGGSTMSRSCSPFLLQGRV